MHQDPSGFYKKQILEIPFPLLTRIDSPWQNSPDLQTHNQKLFNRLKQILKQMELQRTSNQQVPSKGVLLLGESGMGKTHLLMRLVQTLSGTFHLMFIRKPNNEDAVARHVWTNMLESLVQPLPQQESVNQLEAILSHVLTFVLIPALQKDIEEGKNAALKKRWLRYLQKSPENLAKMLGTGRTRTNNVRFLRRKALAFLTSQHPDLEVAITEALITYCFQTDPHRKRSLLAWLKGQMLPPEEAKKLGLSDIWLEVPSEATPQGTIQHKEEKALQAIRTIGILSTYYHPLILAFDQLEGLRNDKKITQKWGDTIREIFTMAPNLLVLTCIFPSLWEQWFRQQLDNSTIDRIAEREFTLEALTQKKAQVILETHLTPINKQLQLPTPLYPFTPDDLQAIFEPKISPRLLLRKAQRMLEDWTFTDGNPDEDSPDEEDSQSNQSIFQTDIFQSDKVPSKDSTVIRAVTPIPPKLPSPSIQRNTTSNKGENVEEVQDSEKRRPGLQETVSGVATLEPLPQKSIIRTSAIRAFLHKCLLRSQEEYGHISYVEETPNEEDLFGHIRALTQFFIRQQKLPLYLAQVTHNKVLPPHFLIKHPRQKEPICCVAVCNGYGIAFTNRLHNLLQKSSNILFIRDKRCNQPGRKGQNLISKLEQNHGTYISIKYQEHSSIYAIYDVLTQVQQHDLLLEDDSHIKEFEFFQVLQQEKMTFTSQILRLILRALEETHPKTTEETRPKTTEETRPKTTEETHLKITESQIETKKEKKAQSSFEKEIYGIENNHLEKSFELRQLNLPPGPKSYLEEAEKAITEEFLLTSQNLKLVCQSVSPLENMSNMFELTLLEPPHMQWSWEGSVAFQPEECENSILNLLHESNANIQWKGQIIQVEESTARLFVYVKDTSNPPQTGMFLVRPFAFLEHLQKLFAEKRFSWLQKLLPSLLQASLEGASSSVTKHSPSIWPFQNLWPSSWSILWGPPGTGKTTSISNQVVESLENSNERMLILSTTNQATDDLALRIAKQILKRAPHQPLQGTLLRVGKGAKYNTFEEQGLEQIIEQTGADLLRRIGIIEKKIQQKKNLQLHETLKLSNQLEELRQQLKSESVRVFLKPSQRIVVTTIFNAGSLITQEKVEELLEAGHAPFTTVMIDEAGVVSRATIAVLALLASRRVILVGDPMQLSPISQISRILPAVQARWRGQSALGHLQAKNSSSESVFMLTKQYRMHPSISKLISHYRYNNQLEDAEEVSSTIYSAPFLLKNEPRGIWYVLDEDTPNRSKIRAERGPFLRSWERLHTFGILKKIFSAHPEFEQGKGLFLTPFTAQVNAARTFLAEQKLTNWQAATVHSQQGAEADYVFFDTVQAGSHAWPHDEWQRLINVALSRARNWLIVFASRQEMREPYLQSLTEHLAPRIFQEGRKKQWFTVAGLQTVPFHTPLEGSDPSSLGYQFATRKQLHPLLSAEQERLCGYKMDGRPRLVRGVAGSGKTLVLAHWICQLLKEPSSTERKICVVYGNSSLHSLIKESIQRAWDELHSQSLEKKHLPWESLYFEHIQTLLQQMTLKIEGRCKKNVGYHYNKISTKLLLHAKSKGIRLESWCDALFIDEAQDMGPETLQLLSLFVKHKNPDDPKSKPMMIFYDNAQNLYGRSAPKWSELGLEMRGRSTVMKESFRSTKQITECAINVLYSLASPEQDPDYQELIQRKLLKKTEHTGRSWWEVHFTQINGPLPSFQEHETYLLQIKSIAEQLRFWIREEKVSPQDIKILFMGPWQESYFKRIIEPALTEVGAKFVIQRSETYLQDENTVIATTPHSFKGYDAEIIILISVSMYAGKEAQILYVAMTRARSMLVMHAVRAKKHVAGSDKAKLLEVLKHCTTQSPAKQGQTRETI